MKFSIIIVSHNSEAFLKKNLLCVATQNLLPSEVIIVDSGSTDIAYIEEAINDVVDLNVKLIRCDNIGFAKANNIGIKHLSENCTQVIFLNPDCFLRPGFLLTLLSLVKSHPYAGLITGKLEGYDIIADQNTGLIDSAGIFQTFYGRWYDRGQGEADHGQFDKLESHQVPAVCGALMICQKKLIDLMIDQDGHFFNEVFYMYKEDIEISLRISKTGRDILYFPELKAYHCRGWEKNRTAIPRWARLCSAKNDLLIAVKFRQRALFFAGIKYFFVLLFDF